MRSNLALACAVIAALVACSGSNSTGTSTGGGGAPFSPGVDDGNGSTSGGGTDDPTNAGSEGTPPPRACNATEHCPTGEYCPVSTDGNGGTGVCVEPCALPDGVLVGKSNCPGAEVCYRGEQASVGACKIPCNVDEDCPTVTGLQASCVSLDTTRHCEWYPPATPGGG